MEKQTISLSRRIGQCCASQNWLFHENEMESPPRAATILPLINGEETFEKLYEAINNAQKSIDIAIWGFQPSMFFRRDGQSPCIGDLLIQKAMQGVEVKILVWSIWLDVQTFKEGNLGYMPELFSKSVESLMHTIPFTPSINLSKTAVSGVTEEQREYDYWWYKMMMGDLYEQHYSLFPSQRPDRFKRQEPLILTEAFERLMTFCRFPKRWQNLQMKKRSVTLGSRFSYLDYSFRQSFVLFSSATHHQKAVLIDYDDPKQAVGFVLEHNMLDNYWDTSQHSIEHYQPNLGKNYWGNYQDVSSFVTGEILWDINRNFCQSWDRWSNIMLPSLLNIDAHMAYKKNLTSLRKQHTPEAFIPQGEPIVRAQILRTYDDPNVEEIKQMYLTNIKKVSSFLYTENQYFRWKPLVESFQQHWENHLKEKRPNQPIFWFVVTNSSDEALESGSYNTHEMLKALGRQDAMPAVAKINSKEAEQLDFERNQGFEQQLEDVEKRLKNASTLAEHQQLVAERNQLIVEEEKRKSQLTNNLKQDLSDSIGIKSHICTLVVPDSPNWEEVYIHSKLTIMDDVFTFIGSANLNKRSMEVDTELGIIVEDSQLARELRLKVWGYHVGNNPKANLTNMYNPEVAELVFDEWEILIKENKQLKLERERPKQALCEFLRYSPIIGCVD